MSDLSNLLGAVYGSNDPDGPTTRHEPSAAERVQMPAPPRIDDDLAAALSAALVSSTPEPTLAATAPVAAAPPYSAPVAVAAPVPVAATPAAPPASPRPQPVFTPSSYSAGVVSWNHGDDDIFPMTVGKKR